MEALEGWGVILLHPLSSQDTLSSPVLGWRCWRVLSGAARDHWHPWLPGRHQRVQQLAEAGARLPSAWSTQPPHCTPRWSGGYLSSNHSPVLLFVFNLIIARRSAPEDAAPIGLDTDPCNTEKKRAMPRESWRTNDCKTREKWSSSP